MPSFSLRLTAVRHRRPGSPTASLPVPPKSSHGNRGNYFAAPFCLAKIFASVFIAASISFSVTM